MLVFPARSFLYDLWATPKACGKVNLLALTNPSTGIVIALDDCTKAATNASEKGLQRRAGEPYQSPPQRRSRKRFQTVRQQHHAHQEEANPAHQLKHPIR